MVADRQGSQHQGGVSVEHCLLQKRYDRLYGLIRKLLVHGELSARKSNTADAGKCRKCLDLRQRPSRRFAAVDHQDGSGRAAGTLEKLLAAGEWNALEPGWVATRMGGPGAPDDINQAPLTQAWLAVSNDREAMVTGQYFYHMRPREPNPQAYDTALQGGLVEACERLSGVKLRA